MESIEHVVEYFKVKANYIIYKNSAVRPANYNDNPYLNMSSNFATFHLKMQQVEEELDKETRGLIKKFKNEEDLDVVNLLDNILSYADHVKKQFIQLNKP